jgi:hypothetical protein
LLAQILLIVAIKHAVLGFANELIHAHTFTGEVACCWLELSGVEELSVVK